MPTIDDFEDTEDNRAMEAWRADARARAVPHIGDHAIQPRMINANNLGWGLFGMHELEHGAAKVVRLMQKDNAWRPFMLEEFPDSVQSEIGHLWDYGWIVKLEDLPAGRFVVTEGFIERCGERLIAIP